MGPDAGFVGQLMGNASPILSEPGVHEIRYSQAQENILTINVLP